MQFLHDGKAEILGCLLQRNEVRIDIRLRIFLNCVGQVGHLSCVVVNIGARGIFIGLLTAFLLLLRVVTLFTMKRRCFMHESLYVHVNQFVLLLFESCLLQLLRSHVEMHAFLLLDRMHHDRGISHDWGTSLEDN